MFNEAEKLIIENGIVCPECQTKGAKVSLCTTIAASNLFTDLDGHNHDHDSNYCDAECKCPQGHKWSVRFINSCWCGWKQTNYASQNWFTEEGLKALGRR